MPSRCSPGVGTRVSGLRIRRRLERPD
jgi:hypothetical protein